MPVGKVVTRDPATECRTNGHAQEMKHKSLEGAVRVRLPGFYVPPYKFGLTGTTLLHGSRIRVLEAPHYVYGCLN